MKDKLQKVTFPDGATIVFLRKCDLDRQCYIITPEEEVVLRCPHLNKSTCILNTK